MTSEGLTHDPADGRRGSTTVGRRAAAARQRARAHRTATRFAVGAAVAAAAVAAWVLAATRLDGRRRAEDEARRLALEIHGRRGAERAMRATERRFREVVEASPTGLLMAGSDGRILLANPQAERLFGYGGGELLGRSVEELVPDALRDAHPTHRAAYLVAPMRRLMGRNRDLKGRRRDGTEIPVEIGLSPIGGAADRTVLAAVVDLSARQAEQRALQDALREKTVLLDEVHHRVKNNLQVITSLLSLQARGAAPEAQTALAECRNRVHAMALTHQLLHESGDVTRLHVGEYLARLGRLLADSLRQIAPAVALRVEGTDTPLYLSLPRAIPCGLLVNELVSNAYRHAFPDGRGGTIVIGLACDGLEARLRVVDDGVGLPADVDPAGADSAATRPLGLQLVPLLVDQLGGTLSHSPIPGTGIEVRFPIEATDAPPRTRVAA